MTLVITNYGDVPEAPAMFVSSYTPDQLIAGNLKIISQNIVLAAGTAIPRGAVLGQQTSYSVQSAHGTNTGNGTIGTLVAGVGTLLGIYSLVATSTTAFSVTDPEGTAMTAAASGTPYGGGGEGLGFTITAGGTPFAIGDTFTLNVIDSIGNFIVSVKTASDGSQTPCAILADLADATNGPVSTGAYVMGQFNVNAISYDSSWTPELLTTALRPYSIFLKEALTAADPGNGAPGLT
jgi:hypothetical protein